MAQAPTTTTPKMPACDYTPPAYEGPSRDEVLATRRQYTSPGIFTYYKDPVMFVDGRMQWLFDEKGRRYLDLFAGIATVSCGHCHPKITQAIKDQIDHIQHTTTIYLHPNFGEFAKKLASKLPEGLDVCYFTNSGSEANDLAITMSRLYTGNFDVIALRNAYHGGSPTAMGLTSPYIWKFPLPQGHGVHHAANPDPYRSAFEGTPEEIAHKSAEEVRKTIHFETSGSLAAFICEPIQGVGGVTAGASNYLGEVYEIVRKHGGLCIADEVQTGFGRTGEKYWGFQNYDVTPDIVTMAKGIGNGVPLAAVVTRREIAETLAERHHFNTFGGNPVCMAAGSAVLDVIDDDCLRENSLIVGGRFKVGLERLAASHRLIGDVRGLGLMLGVELVSDRKTKEPATQETADISEACLRMGVLLGKGGIDGNVLRIKPPMCITADDVDFALDVLDRALTEVKAK